MYISFVLNRVTKLRLCPKQGQGFKPSALTSTQILVKYPSPIPPPRRPDLTAYLCVLSTQWGAGEILLRSG